MRQEVVLPTPTIVPAGPPAPARQVTALPTQEPVSCGVPDNVCIALVCSNIPSPPAGRNAAGGRPADTHSTAGTPTGTSTPSYSPSGTRTGELWPNGYIMYLMSVWQGSLSFRRQKCGFKSSH